MYYALYECENSTIDMLHIYVMVWNNAIYMGSHSRTLDFTIISIVTNFLACYIILLYT
jgi:hypothetical protein